jgi:hypothetical protein
MQQQNPVVAATEARGVTSGIVIFLGEYMLAERQAQAMGLTPTQPQKNRTLDLMVFMGGAPVRVACTFTRAGQAWY